MNQNFNWFCGKTWLQSAKNTSWCLLGCSIGDFSTIYYFQINDFNINPLLVMTLAIINGLITSIILETIILLRQMNFKDSLFTALGMSFISMISMEVAMNSLDLIIYQEPHLNFKIIPFMLIVGFTTPWPYNYWRLKKKNISCH